MKSQKLLASFTAYCYEHPEQRFCQALCNWGGAGKIICETYEYDGTVERDTYYWEGRNGSKDD